MRKFVMTRALPFFVLFLFFIMNCGVAPVELGKKSQNLCISNGYSCSTSSQCCSERCQWFLFGATCVASGCYKMGESTCLSDSQCCYEMGYEKCFDGTCCVNVNGPCVNDGDCCSNDCHQGMCDGK